MMEVKQWLHYRPVHWFVVCYNAANDMDLIISMDLPPDVLARYKYKIIQDPSTTLPEIWVNYDHISIYQKVTYPDIYNYLVRAPPPYTEDQLKAYKGLEVYIYVKDGWIRLLMIVPTLSASNSDFMVK